MKKFLLMFFALFAMAFFAKAQTPIFTENFDNGMPSGWTQIDANNDNLMWEHSSSPVSYFPSDVILAGNGHNGSTGFILSGSYSNVTSTAITPDNWLITPAINLTGIASLSFWVCGQDASFSAEHYGVYISTTTNTDTSAFTLLYEATIGQTREQTAWENHTINLSAYNGETVYIAFRHFNCSDEFLLNLDDVEVSLVPSSPAILANPSTVTMSAMVGIPVYTTVQVDGYNLTSTITVSTSIPFGVSTDGINYGTTASLAQIGGTLYVQYSPTTEGTDNGTITLTSGTTNANITLTGTAHNCNIALPYTETFATTSSALDCWTLVSNNTANVGGVNGMGYLTVDGREVLQFSSYNTASDYNQYAFSPILNVSSSAINLQVSVVYGTRPSDNLYFGYITPTDTIWDPTPYNTNSSFSTYDWAIHTFVIPTTATQLAVHYYGDYQYNAWIDNVEITEITSDYCFPVNNLTANNVTAHEATLTWSGNANNYTIYNMADTSSIVATVNDTTYTLTNLTSNTQYSFGVVANCTSGTSNMVIVNLYTLISCPAPTELNVTYNSNVPTEVTLNWTENGTATNWQIVLNGDETNIIDVNQKPSTLTNLVPDSIYTVKMRAICDVDDQSTWSSSTSFEPTSKTVIGSGNGTNNFLPTSCYYSYSLNQQIYTVAELGNAGLIESVDFYNNSNTARTRNLSIYMVSTAKDTFASATDWISVTPANLQYSGNVTFAPKAWTTITLDGFAYDGLSNVAIIIDDNSGSYSSSTQFLTFDANNQALSIHSDNTNYDVTAPAYNGTVMDIKNQIRIAKGDLIDCMKPAGVIISYTGGLTAEVSWTSDAPSFNISVNDVVTNNVTSPYTLTGLDLNTNYTVSVQAVCDASSTSAWTNPTSFTTDACMPENQCNITIVGADSYGDGWSGNAINIIQDGVTIGTFTVASGFNNTETYSVCTGVPVNFSWVEGSYADEANFEIRDGGNTVVYTGNGDDLVEDIIFFTLNDACPSCMPAAELTVDAATVNSITISWTGTAASYDIYNGEVFVANITNTTYTFNGLTPATSYVFSVQAICSVDDSAAITTISTMTECEDITTLPYHESFDNGLACWSTINASADGLPWYFLDDNTYAHTGNGAAISFSYYNYDAIHANNWLISPKFVLPTVIDDSLSLSWWHRVDPYYPSELYDVMISTTTNDTASFTTTLLSVSPDSVGIYVQKMVDITAYAGQEIYIAFHHHDSYNEDFLLIDDIELFESSYEPLTPDSLIINLTVNDSNLGSVTPNPGTYIVAENETLMITATPNDGISFQGYRVLWNGVILTNIPAEANPFPCTVSSALIQLGEITVMAMFSDGTGAPDSLTLIVNTDDATMGTTNPTPGTYKYAVGDTSYVAAIPNDNYHFLYWIESLYIAGTVVMRDTLSADTVYCAITQMMANMTLSLTAYFEANEVTYYNVSVTSSNEEMGTVSSDVPLGQVAENTVVTVTATPATGYEFANWLDGEGNIVNASNPYTFTVTEDITLIANFQVCIGINDVDASNVLIYANNSTIYVRGAEGHDVFVYDMNGRCIYQHADVNETETISMSSAGVYMVRIDNAIFKKVVIVK